MSAAPKRHFIIPDTQVKPNAPTDHIDWIAKALVEYRPDVVIHLGDHWDFPSLNKHEQPGSVPMEGQRYEADLKAGDEAFARLTASDGCEHSAAQTGQDEILDTPPQRFFHSKK